MFSRRRMLFVATLLGVGALVTVGAGPGFANDLTITHQPPPSTAPGLPLELTAAVKGTCSPSPSALFRLGRSCFDIVVTLTYTVTTKGTPAAPVTLSNTLPALPTAATGLDPGVRLATFLVPGAGVDADAIVYSISASQEERLCSPCGCYTTTSTTTAGPYTVPVARMPANLRP